MRRRGAQRAASAAALAALLFSGLGVAAHEAREAPVWRAGAGAESVADGGHAERDTRAHLDPLALRPAHQCLACWLGQLGLDLAPRAAWAAALAATGLALPPAPPLHGATPLVPAGRGPPRS